MNNSVIYSSKTVFTFLFFIAILFSFEGKAQLNCVGSGSLNGWTTQGLVQVVGGGTDFFGGFPTGSPISGSSYQIGDDVTFPQPQSQLSRNFVVSAAAPFLEYCFAFVNLDFPHAAAQAARSSVQITDQAGNDIPCTFYQVFAAAGGPPGFTQSTRPPQCNLIGQCAYNISYLPWRTSVINLTAYIGQTVTITVTNDWCIPNVDWGYGYFDAHCINFEINQVCDGSSITMQAPILGGATYAWSNGATTSSTTVPTPGPYYVDITPFGASCPIRLDYNATIYPLPTASFTSNLSSICLGTDVDFTNTSTVQAGGTITDYQWNFGDGINTPLSSGTITGVTQTSGDYTTPNHVFNTLGNLDVELVVMTADGCSDTTNATISVIEGPEATIVGDNTVCAQDASPEITFTGSMTQPPYTFTYNINGGANQTITTSSTSSSVNLPVPTTPAGSYTYNLINVLSTTPVTCDQDFPGQATITVNPLPTAVIGTSVVVCQGSADQTITFTGANGTSDYIFTYSLNGGANQTITTSGTTTATISVSTAIAGVFSYQLISVEDVATGCSQNQTGTATVVVNPMPDATSAGATIVCQNDAQPVITFTGSNSSNNYTFTYSLNNGANQTLTTTGGATQATINVPTNIPGTFSYELISVIDPATTCGQPVNETQVVVVNPLPAATIAGTTTLCQNAAEPQITFTGSLGTSEYTFTYTINSGAPQTVTTNGSSNVTVNVPTSVATTYTYTLLSVEDVSTGCSRPQTGNATVLVNPTPTAIMDGTVSVCQDSPSPSILFEGQNSSGEYTFSYTINGGPTQTVTSTNGLSATVNRSTAIPGTYVYNLINVMDPSTMCNTDVDLSDTITVVQLPTASISNPLEACHMDADLPVVTFTGAAGEEPYTFTYNINGGTDQHATSTGSIVTFQVPTNTVGDFVYTITHVEEGSALGCQQAQNESTMVTIHALPIVDAGADLTICAGVDIVLTGSGAQTYVWDNGAINGVPFSPADTTTFTVVGTDYNGCQDSDQMTVDVVPIPVMAIDGQDLSGCAPVTPTLTNNSTGNLVNCTWYLGNGDTIQSCGVATSVFPDAGCYDVTLVVSTPEGCTNSLTMNQYICVDPLPVASFYPKPSELSTYDWESQMINESSGATIFQWNYGDGTPIENGASPTHGFPNDEAGEYTIQLVASSPNGCVDTTYGKVTVKEELLFYIPNTFTPDGDAFNETFKPVFTTGYDPYHYELLIFDRWGERVFESHDTNIGWSGKYGIDGKICQDGTYTWKISVKRRTSDERKEYLGHVNLLR